MLTAGEPLPIACGVSVAAPETPDDTRFPCGVHETETHLQNGRLYRFVHEMKPGQLLVYASKADRHVYSRTTSARSS
jgi:hypothetical protein